MIDETTKTIVELSYLTSSVLFMLGLKRMAKVRTARNGNFMSAVAMLIAIVATLVELGKIDYRWILVGTAIGSIFGAISAMRVPMTKMPEMVAIFNGFGGAASMLVAIAYVYLHIIEQGKMGALSGLIGIDEAITVELSIIVGAVTFTGSVVAYLKLNESISGRPILLPARHVMNAALLVVSLVIGVYSAFIVDAPAPQVIAMWVLAVASLVLGVLLVIPIGGADMPVVISLLNSYSGIAGCMTGFVLSNNVLIISGGLVGASGIILTKIMCVAMNRSLANVVFGGFGAEDTTAAAGGGEYRNVKSTSSEEAAMVLEDARSVVFVPGYGLAVAQAQHATRELADILQARGATVKYAIHPVAGRMPGHMNVLLAEADVPYEQLIEMDQINPEFKDTDVAIVLGANDVVNPAAQTEKGSPIYGMPILEVFNSRTVFVVKRSLGAGFAGIKNELFERDNTLMVFGDAKKVLQQLVAELKSAAH